MYTYDETLKTTGSEMILNSPLSMTWLGRKSYDILSKFSNLRTIGDLLNLGKDNLYLKISTRVESLNERFEIIADIESALAMLNLRFKDSDFDKTKIKLSYLNFGDAKKYVSSMKTVGDLLLCNYKKLWRSLSSDDNKRTAHMNLIESALEKIGLRLVGSHKRLRPDKIFPLIKVLETYYKENLQEAKKPEPVQKAKPKATIIYKTIKNPDPPKEIKAVYKYPDKPDEEDPVQVIKKQMSKLGFNIFENFDYNSIKTIDDVRFIKEAVLLYLEERLKKTYDSQYGLILSNSIDALSNEINNIYFPFIINLYTILYRDTLLSRLESDEYNKYQEILYELGKIPIDTSNKLKEILNSFTSNAIDKPADSTKQNSNGGE